MGTVNVLIHEGEVILVTGFTMKHMNDIIKLKFPDLDNIVIQTWCGGHKIAEHLYDKSTRGSDKIWWIVGE